MQKRRAVVVSIERFPGPAGAAVAGAVQFAARPDRRDASPIPASRPCPTWASSRCGMPRPARSWKLDTRHPPGARAVRQPRRANGPKGFPTELRKVGVDELAIRTDEDYLKSFRRFFHMRERRFR